MFSKNRLDYHMENSVKPAAMNLTSTIELPSAFSSWDNLCASKTIHFRLLWWVLYPPILRGVRWYLAIISCSTCCLVGLVKATWVCASFDSNLVIISCRTTRQQVLQLMMTRLDGITKHGRCIDTNIQWISPPSCLAIDEHWIQCTRL